MPFYNRIAVFYDGACKVCSWEMETYKRQDVHSAIELIDISHSDFDAASYGLDHETVQRVLHVRRKDGKIATGVNAFIEIWQALDRPFYRLLACSARQSAIRALLELGYRGFIRIRPWLPRKKCEDGQCLYRKKA